ncbi:GNAT family N-acetyltransferase [Myxococcota bacterium]|nr:GNAT family N-acetyltransferase [Myxococcota bacterium]MBU1382790.1 GNAT family N-acetyltransferase [Myxococcota bacterium]MBU1495936.1 GNAT family N-acetyltransferase [Myxococcota bacterium]
MLPAIHTQDLDIIICSKEHASLYADFVLRNKAFHGPWDPLRPDEYYSVKYWERELSASKSMVEAGSFFRFTVFEKDKPKMIIGQCALSNIARGVMQSANMGYALDRRFTGRGYMTQTVLAVVDYAFGALNLHRIQAGYMPHNRKSGKVLKRCGFRIEGYAKNYILIDGKWEDHILTSRTNHNWTV